VDTVALKSTETDAKICCLMLKDIALTHFVAFDEPSGKTYDGQFSGFAGIVLLILLFIGIKLFCNGH
jgi:hypothetical protein